MFKIYFDSYDILSFRNSDETNDNKIKSVC